MYSPLITKQTLDRLQSKLDFPLVRRSVAESEFYVDHFNSFLDRDTGELPADFRFSQPEMDYIRSERVLCKYDFRYWLERYVKVKSTLLSDTERIVRPSMTVAWQMVLDVWAELEARNSAIMCQQLKARQLGMSTLDELAIAHRAQFYSNVNALIGSSTPAKTEKMGGIITLCYELEPYWLMPIMKGPYESGEMLLEFPELNSAITMQHGAKMTGIARGETPDICHLCLAPQTLIHTAEGRLIPVSEITEGDSVITSRGLLAPVKRLVKSSRQNEATREIYLWGNPLPLSSTEDHPVLTPDGFVAADCIEKGSYVVHPIKPLLSGISEISFQSRLAGGDNKIKDRPEITIDLELDRELGWLCGLYLAEGSINQNNKLKADEPFDRVVFAVHDKEVERFSCKLQDAIGALAPVRSRKLHGKTSHLVIYSSGLARWLARSFGRTMNKSIPDWVWDTGYEFCVGLLQGYLEGDGHLRTTSNEIYVSSICPPLLIQLRDLIASLGFGWTSLYKRKEGFYYGRNCKEIWTLLIAGDVSQTVRECFGWTSFSATKAKHWKWSDDRKSIYVQVKRNEQGFSETFYDIEVDAPEHDFCTIQCCVKNSEIPEWVGDPKELIDASLMPSIHPNPRTFVILESTAAGMHDWWHQTWDISSEGYDDGTSTFRPIFLPWFIGTDVWPTQTWKNDHPIPADWTPTAKGSQHAERAKKYVATNALVRKFLGDDWEMPLDQTWFWECYRSEMVRKKALNLFLQEMPADPLEAFQTTNLTVFDVETIEMLNDQRSAPWGCFGIESNLLPRRLWPERRDFDLSRKPIELTWFTGEATLHFTLRPLTYDGYPSCSWENRVFIWEPPLKGAKYGVGVDTSYGLGQDRSTIEVVKEGSIINPAVQVAEFANAYVNSIDLTPICMCISAFYSSCYTDQMEQPLVAIECAGNGETTQLEMRKQGWSNFHRWERYDNMKRTRVHKLGWFTNSWSRPMLIDRTNQAIRDCNFKINSPWLIQELRTLSKDEFQQSIRADTGGHDDRYMGAGIAFFCLHVWKSVVQGDEDVFSSQAREQAKKQLEDWESRWKGGEHMFDFSLPTLQPVIEQQPDDGVYSGLVKTLDDDPLWGMSHE